MYRTIFLGVAIAALAGLASASDKQWTEVQSAHFRVLTNGEAGDARRVAREFEQMRAVFSSSFPNMRLETGAPLLVFAPLDEDSMKKLAPARWKVKGAPRVAGFFLHGWDRQFAVICIEQDIPGTYQVVYHEYVHTLLHANFQWLPTWLDEGFAEYYGGTRFEKSKIYIGAPTTRVYSVQGQPLIPLEKLLTINPFTEFRGDERQIDLFYSESWALVHYMVFGPDMGHGKKLTDFFRKLQGGEEQKQAFTETFGTFDSMQKALELYVRHFSFGSFVLSSPEQLNEKDFAVRKLSIAETDAAIGSFRLWWHDLPEAREIIEQGLKDDPKLAELHEDMGFLNFADGKDEEAKNEFTAAYALDPQRFLSVYFKTMMSAESAGNAAANEEAIRTGLRETIKINPEYAPAYVQLALLYIHDGDLKPALAVSRKAEELEPSRAGYHILSGQILERMGQGAKASEFARYVAERWHGPDHNEAVELWKSVPENERSAGEALGFDAMGTLSAEGTISNVTCADKDHGATATLQRGTTTMKFHVNGGFSIGFSDTTWYGSDHFSSCHHVDGMRAVVWYKPSTTKDYDGDASGIELRAALPTGPDKQTTAIQPAARPDQN